MPLYYGYGFGIDPAYLILVAASIALGFLAQTYINNIYSNTC